MSQPPQDPHAFDPNAADGQSTPTTPQGTSDPTGRPAQPRYGQYADPEAQAAQQGQQNVPGQQGHPSPYGQAPQNPYGQHPYGQNPYGQAPQNAYGQMPPSGFPQPPAPVQRPKTVETSYWLILAAGVVFGILNVVTALMPNMGVPRETITMLEDLYDDAGMNLDFESMVPGMRVTSIIVTILLVGVYYLIARGIRNGSNVARVFGTIFAVLSLASVFGLGIVFVALGIAGIVYAYLRPSNEYFRARAWEKANGLRR